MVERLPGATAEKVLSLFSRGETFDAEGFTDFFTDTPVYQFGNFEICLSKAELKASIEAFFAQVDALYHNIKMIWEVGDAAFVEMDVTYWRKDGSVITLPCFDIFRLDGDRFSELRIYMDANPVGNAAILVSALTSNFTLSQGQRLDSPNLMKQFFATHPEGIRRVQAGYVPKWSIAGPKWKVA